MALNLQQLQKQTQRLIMTPQMQQSIQLLQLNSIELEQLTQQELLENPFLTLEEEGPSGAESANEAGSEQSAAEPRETDAMDGFETDFGSEVGGSRNDDAAFTDRDFESPNGVNEFGSLNGTGDIEHPIRLETASPNDFEGDGPATAAGEASELLSGGDSLSDEAGLSGLETDGAAETFDQVDLNWDDYYSDSENPTYLGANGEDSEERDFTEYVASKTSLSEKLDWQIRCSVLDGIEIEIAGFIIGSLNEDGYLDPAVLDEAIEHFTVPREVVDRVLGIVQEFDPPGIAARSLPECLLIQMRALGSYSELAREVLENHLIEFQKKKYRELSRKLNVTEEALNELHQKVCRLEPHPGRSISTDAVQYIQPDVYVKNVDGELMIYLNEGLTRRLSVDRFYRRLMRQHRAAMNAQDKEYALEKYRSALTLIKNIEKRKSTILYVTQAIMDVQRQFLDKGIASLRPLTLREVADKVGMHESTVARVTSRKYVETPQGVFPLKFFFSSSIESQDGGDAVSSRAIKDKLRKIIDQEDDKRPLSDQKIASMLNKEGFDIARRTVAKYREQLKILPAKYRRQT